MKGVFIVNEHKNNTDKFKMDERRACYIAYLAGKAAKIKQYNKEWAAANPDKVKQNNFNLELINSNVDKVKKHNQNPLMLMVSNMVKRFLS